MVSSEALLSHGRELVITHNGPRVPPAVDAKRKTDPDRLETPMGQMLLVTLREGIEMFLIVAIAATYLRKSGRAALLFRAVGWGTATAIAASVVLGTWLAEVAVLPKWEALLALVAAVLVISNGDLHAQGGQAPAARHRCEAGSRGRADRPRGIGSGCSCSSYSW